MQRLPASLIKYAVVTLITSLSGATLAFSAGSNGLRNVFLNGIDISSAKSQDLKNVDVHITESGDIFLVAPHYQVNEEDNFVPLSRYVQGLNQPQHQTPQKVDHSIKATPGAMVPISPPMPVNAAGPQVPASGVPAAAGASPEGEAASIAPAQAVKAGQPLNLSGPETAGGPSATALPPPGGSVSSTADNGVPPPSEQATGSK